MKLGKTNTIRLAAVLIFIAVSAGITYLVFPYAKLIMTADGLSQVKADVLGTGIWGPLIFMLIVAVQIIIAFIPGGPVEILGGALFGSAAGTILCLGGFIIGTVTVFVMVKKVGRPLVNAFVSEKQLSRFKFLQSEEKLELITFVLFLIPGIPKDILTYIVPLTDIDPKRFILIAAAARLPATFSSVMIGSSIESHSIVKAIIAFAITAVLGICGIIIRNRKRNDGVNVKKI